MAIKAVNNILKIDTIFDDGTLKIYFKYNDSSSTIKAIAMMKTVFKKGFKLFENVGIFHRPDEYFESSNKFLFFIISIWMNKVTSPVIGFHRKVFTSFHAKIYSKTIAN